ncbi:CU044_2847 family protein [Pseudonocardia saturnea]
MPEYVDVPVDGDLVLVVEVPPDSAPTVVEAGRARELSEQVATSFTAAIDSIRGAAETVIDRARTMANSPSEVTVEFSVQLAAGAGVVIASTAATANMRVAFRWERDEP